AELDNRAGAHHAGRQRGIEKGVVVTPAPARILQAIHLAMGDRIAVLHAAGYDRRRSVYRLIPAPRRSATPPRHSFFALRTGQSRETSGRLASPDISDR